MLTKGCSTVGTQDLGHQPPCQSQPWGEALHHHTPPHPGPGRRRPVCRRAPPCLAHPTATSPFSRHISSAALLSSSPSIPPSPQALPPLAAPHPSPSSQPAASTSASSASRVPQSLVPAARGPGPAPQGWRTPAGATRPVSRADQGDCGWQRHGDPTPPTGPHPPPPGHPLLCGPPPPLPAPSPFLHLPQSGPLPAPS